MSQRAVAVSPHLDDAVFSVGGTLALLAQGGWDVGVVTCFTASVADPTPFALSTQLDKGLAADADYMAIRRDEDVAACALLGVTPVHLPLPEAPHRGYDCAAELFAGVRADDRVAVDLASRLVPYVDGADLVLAPQAVGDHVDHRVVVDVVRRLLGEDRPGWWWRDLPYALRRPDAAAWSRVPDGAEVSIDTTAVSALKLRAAGCYRTQLGFQLDGDVEALRATSEVVRPSGGPCHPPDCVVLPRGSVRENDSLAGT